MGSLAYVEVDSRDVDDDDEDSTRIIAIGDEEGGRVGDEDGDEDDEVVSFPRRESGSRGGRWLSSGTTTPAAVAVVCSFVVGCLFGSLAVVFVGGYYSRALSPRPDNSGRERADDVFGGEEVKGITATSEAEEENDVAMVGESAAEAFVILEKMKHDPTAFTQGLSYEDDGKAIFQTTGMYGQSKVQRLNPDSFDVELSVDMGGQFFGEGSTFYRDAEGNGRLIVITWQEHTGFIYDSETLEKIREFEYTTTPPQHEGWGITYDASEQEFIVSDGSNYLYFWDRDTLVEKRKVAVTRRVDGRDQNQLNELEFIDGLVCCNIWYSDEIICVDKTSGKSVREYDLSSLYPANEIGRGGVLNGIALGKDHVLITGKNWDRMFKIVFPDWTTLFQSSTGDELLVIDNGHNATANNDDANVNEDANAVSYNFLRTTKGSETMRLLLDDLLLPPQMQQGTPMDVGFASLLGPRRALTHLWTLMDEDGQISSSCHPLAHNLGRVAYQIFGSLDAAYDGMVGTDDAHLLRLCNAAYLHGVIEFHLRDVPPDNLASAALEIESNVCVNLANVNFGTWECHHGIGHGIIQRHRMEAEKDVIQKSVKSCEEVFGASGGATDCENGVWMDHFAVSGNILAMETKMMAMDIVANELKGALSVLAESQNGIEGAATQLPPLPSTLQICHLGSHAVIDCFTYAATEYLLVHPRDYLGAIRYCTDPSANIQPSEARLCVAGAASQCAKENMHDFSTLEEVCRTLDDENEGVQCFQNGLNYFRMSTENKSPRDAGLCDNLTRYQINCLNG